MLVKLPTPHTKPQHTNLNVNLSDLRILQKSLKLKSPVNVIHHILYRPMRASLSHWTHNNRSICPLSIWFLIFLFDQNLITQLSPIIIFWSWFQIFFHIYVFSKFLFHFHIFNTFFSDIHISPTFIISEEFSSHS